MYEKQLDRIEGKLDRYAKQTATNTADIVWLKRAVIGAIGSFLTLTGALLFNLITRR